jgi:hypothetical protein
VKSVMSAARTSRDLLDNIPLVTAMGAHNPFGARLVKEAGFDAVWASGFELSASLGVPDAGIVTMSEPLETTRPLAVAPPPTRGFPRCRRRRSGVTASIAGFRSGAETRRVTCSRCPPYRALAIK